jgi:Flp pilus assembly pilin Flp
MKRPLRAWLGNICAATAIEYGLIAAIISVSILTIVFTLGDQIAALFQYALDKITGVL